MAYIELTKGGSDSRTKSTISCWVKRGLLGSTQYVWGWGENNSSDAYLRFDSGDNIEINCDGAGTVYNSTALYRDTNAWYHLVFSLDGSNGTANLRRRFWVNGVQQDEGNGSISTFSTAVMGWLSTQDLWIGANPRSQQGSDISAFSGYISHFHYCDGYSYAASDFGETDSVTGEWKIKTAPSVNYGTAGFFCKMENSSNMDEDSSGNNKTLVTNGTITLSQDSPSNIFATWNPLYAQKNGSVGDVTFINGNTTTVTSSSYRTTPTTLGMIGSGKYYWEIKRNEDDGNDLHAGVMSEDATPTNTATWIGNAANGWVIAGDAGQPYTGGTSGSVISNTIFANAGDIHMCAYDASTGKLYFGANGTWGGTANPSTGANPHYTLDNTKVYFPCVSTGSDCSANFGNGYFGTTAVSSAGSNASNIGTFEYDVPTGFTALCTKGINSF